MKSIGELLKELRQSQSLVLREVAAATEIDATNLSKMERGCRFPNKNHIYRLQRFFNRDYPSVLLTWLSDKLVRDLEEEDQALRAIQVAEEKIRYKRKMNQTVPPVPK